ncbi:phosphoribosylformylglycinamidine synthase [Anaerovorax odorimutans]|uniref:phosphoribosylformylglycinamidine synthase n=1 Tax=Anaerovorax odorimutans TaxID=109327 RepID=UPI0003FF7A3F|nr:phosphoribosylformylglycinamidine synthase [Anaerovorax odorimutans]
MVKRIYVEKKQGFDIEAQNLYKDIKENLHLKELNSLRIINRYDIEGIDDDTYENAKHTIFSEPAIDFLYIENIEINKEDKFFAATYLPGQYDQRADSAEQCIRLMNVNSEALVKFAKVIVVSGNISENDFNAIKNYCINPVDSCEATIEKPEKLEMDMVIPEDVKVVDGFINMTDKELEQYRQSQGFAMSSEDIKFVRDYFKKDENRDATITELKVIDTYWSDHCRHTTFLTNIKDVYFEEGPYADLIKEAYNDYLNIRKEVYGNKEKNMSLMDLAVIGAKYLKKKGQIPDLDESDEINACSIKVKAVVDGKEEDWLVMFKNETHNHPTEIEPFGGAATCLGGAIRDPLSGRVYVYQAMRVTGSGDPRANLEETLAGKLPQRKITTGAAKGYSSYGNQIGLATGQVSEIYDEGYIAKRMEVGAVIGAAPAKNVKREKPAEGDYIILVGGRTGRDGCGGATGSSKEHTEESILNCGAEVQKGNPPVERNIQRLYRREEVTTLIKRCNDFGAGGVSVAIGELADSLDVNLDLVLKKYEGLDGTELAISESQERMAAVVSEKDYKKFIEYANEENLEAVAVARVTNTGRFRMYWRNKKILDLSREFLNTNGVNQETKIVIEEKDIFDKFDENSVKKITVHLQNLNCCSQKGLIECFDSTIGAGTVLMPLGGKSQLTPSVGMAAKLPITNGYTDTATLMTYGFDPNISKYSPYHGALYAVIDSATKIVAMGGDYRKARLSFQEYFERLSDAESWGKPFSALLGALKAQLELGIPSIGGKDSMSGTFMDIKVPPTLISFAVGTVDASKVISPEFKKTGSNIVLIDNRWDERQVIDFEQYRNNMARIIELTDRGKILSANTIEQGGIVVSLVKMAVGNKIGASLDYVTEKELHEQNYGALLLEIEKNEDLEELFQGIEYKKIGTTIERQQIEVQVVDAVGKQVGVSLGIEIDEIIKEWTKPLESVFPTKTSPIEKAEKIETVSFETRNTNRPNIKIAKPRVFIPAFPGTNCEMDSKRAFDKVGAISQIQILTNLTPSDLNDSIKKMAENIKQSQIVMIPGGFSGGDEPDGSAKFITAVFRNQLIKEAIMDLLENRDGLMLGICNGFQALIKLGLVPYGKIIETDENSPTLTYNRIGRHASCLVNTRIASVKSPWLSNVQVGDVHTIPVSHGEGRFIANDSVLNELKKNGQIATQYVDLEKEPTLDIRFNPNGSAMAIEGITSPDGRILGKMGHSERIGENLYKNVPGNYDQKIFKSGVEYFK